MLINNRYKKIYMLFVLGCVLLFSVQQGHAMLLQGHVTKVRDGDTFVMQDAKNKEHVVRLYGIDCPEKKQKYGQEATDKVHALLQHTAVTVDVVSKDRYGRLIGIVYVQEQNVQSYLLEEGLAWIYPQYCRKKSMCVTWSQTADLAKDAQRGLWQEKNPTPPWQWRKRARR